MSDTIVTADSAGLKPLPQAGGPNVGMVKKGDILVVQKDWVHVTMNSGALTGQSGFLHSTAIGPAVVPPPPPPPSGTFFCSIDTMKESMDTGRNQLSAAAIDQTIKTCAALNPTHITMDCHTDYGPYAATWVNAIRAHGKSVWFRVHPNQWENSNNVPGMMTPGMYLVALASYIHDNPLLFKAGDIFDACPEPENGKYWQATHGANYTSGSPNEATDEFNQFLVDTKLVSDKAFAANGITGIITGVRSTNQWWASHPNALYKSTVDTLGYVAFDSYPDNATTDPATAAKARSADIQAVVKARPGAKLVLAEFGFSNKTDVDDATQDAVIKAELAEVGKFSEVVGLNYWVGPGTSHSGGYTHILSGSSGNWAPRPAAHTLADFFAKQK